MGDLGAAWRNTLDWAEGSPLVWLLVTLLTYRLALWVHRRTGGHPLAQPVLTCVLLLGGLLLLTGVPYADYRAGTEVIAFLLGPATVAFAVPLHRSVEALRGLVGPILLALVLGVTTAVATGYGLVVALGGDDELAATMAAKTATTPVAIAVADVVGGIGPLSAVFAVLAGILGAVAAPAVLDLLRITDPRARGVAIGTVSHGVGTSRALREGEVTGAVAGLTTGLAALVVSLVTPLVVAWFS
ncbi:MAG: LrgB family protein [Nocardioides sp.]|uniref:LrgB family protein n=1 Tax=Nocardioides sp. TaxID=35761 RepID=UPI003EFBE1F3